MNILKILIRYILTSIVFFAIDMLWLGVIAKNLYQKYLGEFLTKDVNWTAAIIFYFLFIIGISIFAIYPAAEKDSLFKAVWLGGLFGCFTYATYDLTNLATLKGWPITIVIIDIAWGAVLTATVSVAGYFIVKMIN